MAQKDPADVLEDAADYLLIHGRCRGEMGYMRDDDTRCALGALAESMENRRLSFDEIVSHGAARALDQHPAVTGWSRPSRHPSPSTRIPDWNDLTEDDFEVIDTMRRVAKSLRNAAVAS